MFGNIYWKYILRSVRDKELVIWTFLFPILLSTLFYFSIGSIDKAEMFTSIPTAVVADERLKKEIYLEKLLDTLSDGEDAILEIVQTKDVQEADALLRDDRVEGFITVENGAPKLYVKENGIYQTILKNILNRYIQTKDTVMAVIEKNPASALEFAKDIRENWEDMGAGIEQLPAFKGNAVIDGALLLCTSGYGMPVRRFPRRDDCQFSSGKPFPAGGPEIRFRPETGEFCSGRPIWPH